MEEPWSFTLEARRSQKRARFNLLALEHDEYYFQVRVHRNEERNDSIFSICCTYFGGMPLCRRRQAATRVGPGHVPVIVVDTRVSDQAKEGEIYIKEHSRQVQSCSENVPGSELHPHPYVPRAWFSTQPTHGSWQRTRERGCIAAPHRPYWHVQASSRMPVKR